MGGFVRLLCIYLVVMLTVPALWTLVHGQADVTDQSTPTPDKTLRSNEKISSKTDDEAVVREEEQMSHDGFSVKERRILEDKGEKHVFQAEVNKLMNIIINSLYSNSEIFLRELISNASDALDKIRFFSLTDPSALSGNSTLDIRIRVDKEANTITITDSGLGMTRDDLINNLGTIAKSGTTEFLKAYQVGGDASLIGQFGVGFYSVFLVADRVTVISKNNTDKQYVWISDAQGSFSISEDPRGNTLGRGTSIILEMKEEAEEFLDEKAVRNLVMRYSEFINYPIYLWSAKTESREVDLTEEELKEQAGKSTTEADGEDKDTISLDEEEDNEPDTGVQDQDQDQLPRTKTVEEEVWDWELMNETKPIWTRNPKDITPEEYHAFYTAYSKGDTVEPVLHIHFIAEGEVDFKSLLYIPGTAPDNMYEGRKEGGHRGLKLYVRRVFITDEFRDILPKYLTFLKGVIDSDDLPLNVSRETLQESKTLKIIKKKVVRKAISMFQQMQQDEDQTKWNKFWELYGQNIKLGVIEDAANKQRLSQLLQFGSSKSESTTLQQYVDRMKEGQKQIYALACERLEDCRTSPLAEKLVAQGLEIIYMADAIDEYTINALERFDGKYKFTNIAKDGVEIDGQDKEKDDEEKEQFNTQFATLKTWLKNKLHTQVEKVVITTRLVSSPAALVTGTFGWTANMERIIKAQALSDPKAAEMNAPKKILEINPNHVLIKELNRRVNEDSNDKIALEIAEMLYDTSALTSGFQVNNPNILVNRVLKMMAKSMESELPQEVVQEVQNMKPIESVEPIITVPKSTKAETEVEDMEHDEL